MNRRRFVALLSGAAVWPAIWPRLARAQQKKVFRIGILNFDNPEPLGSWLREGLQDLGYTDGQNVQFEYRSAEGDRSRLAGLASELVNLKTDVIVAYPTPAVIAVKQLTQDIPIIMLGAADPVGTGLVASLSRPGGNITGTSSTTPEVGIKTLEVIRDLLPSFRRVAVLANASDPFSKPFVEQMRRSAQTQQLEFQAIAINRADELEAALANFKKESVDAVVVQPSLPRSQVAELAIRHRLPAIAPTAVFATLGGLVGFSGNNNEIARRTAALIDKILRGSRPAELPVEQPTTFQLVLNLKTAKALGITVPPALFARADEVIE